MLHHLSVILCLSTTIWHVALSRSIGCHLDESAYQSPKAPKLELPWGTYEGKPTDSSGNVTLYKNVRFGQAPIGDLRFKASKFPEASKGNVEIQDMTSGPICMQAGLPDSKTGKFPPKKEEETEDCLFLDIYVPNKAFTKDEPPFPVVVYLYGGAFFSGYKDPILQLGSQNFNLYDAKGMLNASENDFIWVVGNYRVGAFGWLAGQTMEADGTPNAGLHDQKLLLEFIQKYVGKVNGDPGSVSLWGNSAGGASILHHITAGEFGDAGPTFHTAALWSPSHSWLVDRKGALEYTFTNFTKKAGCKKATLECLRNADAAVLRKANEELVHESISKGIFPYGPALDGSYVRQLPTGVLGSYGGFKSLRSVLVSHVIDEVGLYLPKVSWIDSEAKFQDFLNATFPGDQLAEVREAVTDEYPVLDSDDKKLNQTLRAKRIIRDSTILCNAKALTESYRYVYAMEFDFPPGLHGSDLLPTMWNSEVNTGKFVDELLGSYVNDTTRRLVESKLAGLSAKYQRYIASYAAYANPNAFVLDEDPIWQPATKDPYDIVQKVMHVGLDESLAPTFKPLPDLVMRGAYCSLWKNIASYIGDGNPTITDSRFFAGGQKVQLRVQSEQTPGRSQMHIIPWEL